MFTPQQIEQISFGKATFGGYDMNDVDEFLEPLTEDYITLYKENALLKSKMRILVGKLEEYRKNEASMKDAMVNAQKTCDKMIAEAEAKCAEMLSASNAAATQNTVNTEALVAAENNRLEEARKAISAALRHPGELPCCLALPDIFDFLESFADSAPDHALAAELASVLTGALDCELYHLAFD